MSDARPEWDNQFAETVDERNARLRAKRLARAAKADNTYFGSMTRNDGTRVPLSEEQAKSIWTSIDEQEKHNRIAMPDTHTALMAILRAKERLRKLRWHDGVYCPKDGSVFAVAEYGSTGIFRGFYHGEWPSGHVMVFDYLSRPEGLMWKPLAELTPDEKTVLDQCEANETEWRDRWIELHGESAP